jgi:hypothetical protein
MPPASSSSQSATVRPSVEPVSESSSCVHTESTARSISVILAPTKGKDQVKASMKLGSQYGWADALNWLCEFSIQNSGAPGHEDKSIPYCNILILVLDHRSLVVIHVQIVRRTEHSDNRRELLGRCLAGHMVPRSHRQRVNHRQLMLEKM